MRISANNTDVSWDVWLDGVLQKFVVTADDDLGEVERFAFNSDGSARVNGDSLETELVRGKVEIRPAGVGLVAPVWSDCGAWSVGEVTVTFKFKDWEAQQKAKPSDPNAKPALPALTRVSGNKRGPGWCSEE